MARLGGKQIGRLIGYVLGLAMVGAAIALALREMDWSTLTRAAWWLPALLCAAVLINLLLAAAIWWVITLSFDAKPRVGYGLMLRLIAASELLNYLPLRAGLVGRTAFLKARHGLPVRQSLAIFSIVMGVSVAVLLPVGLAMLLVTRTWALMVSGLVVAVWTVAAGPLARSLLRRAMTCTWSWAPLRAVDLLVNAARLWLAFGIIGRPIDPLEAVVLASAALLVQMAQLTPNGLGVREWVVALLAGAISPIGSADALAATVVDRAASALVAILTGLIALPTLRTTRSTNDQSGSPLSEN